MTTPANWTGPGYDYLLAPMLRASGSISLDFGNPKHAPTIHACFDAERARLTDPLSAETAELVDRAKTMRAELAATYPIN